MQNQNELANGLLGCYVGPGALAAFYTKWKVNSSTTFKRSVATMCLEKQRLVRLTVILLKAFDKRRNVVIINANFS